MVIWEVKRNGLIMQNLFIVGDKDIMFHTTNIKEILKEPDKFYKYIKDRFTKQEVKLCLITYMTAFCVHYNLYSQQLTNPDGRWFGGGTITVLHTGKLL